MYKGKSRVPLRIFPVFQGFQGVNLSKSSSQTLQRCYGMESDHPAKVLDEVWNHKFPASLGIVEGLFTLLRSEPMLFLLISQEEKEISFGVKYWGCNAPDSFGDYLLTEEDGREILKYCTEKLQEQDINPKDLERSALRECGRVMSKCMTLMGSFFADAHYLIYESVTPQLPQLLPQLVRGIEDIPVVQKLVWEMMSTYEVILDKLKGDRAMLVPDLALDMAQALASINRNMAQAKLDYALKSWLQLRGVNCDPDSSLLKLVGDNVAYGDQELLQRLERVYNLLCQDDASVTVKVIQASISIVLKLEMKSDDIDSFHTNSIAFCTDFIDIKIFATGGYKTIKLWDVISGSLLATLQGLASRIESLIFSPDGNLLAYSMQNDRIIRLLDVKSLQVKPYFFEHSDTIVTMAFSPNSQILASSSYDNSIKIWDVANNKLKAVFLGHSDLITSIAFNSEGDVLASVSNDKTIRLWDVSSSELITNLEIEANYSLVVFSPNDRKLAVSYLSEIHLYRISNGLKKQPFVFREHSDSISSMTFISDKMLVSAGRDKTIKFWNMEKYSLMANLPAASNHFSTPITIACGKGGIDLACASNDGTVTIWNLCHDFYMHLYR